MLVLGLTALESRLPGLAPRVLYGPKTILINMTYLQNVTRTTQILGVAWTLCLEIQFYLVFILILGAARMVHGEVTRGNTPLVASGLVFGLGAISLACSTHQEVDLPFFVPFWSYFASGVLCYWALKGKIPAWAFWAFIGLIAITTAWHRLTPTHAEAVFHAELACLLIATIFFLVGTAGHLTDWLGGPVFKFFGRISYSLYLMHFPVLSLVMRAGYKVTGENERAALVWFVVAIACTVAGGQLLYMLVEAPSMRFASKFKRRKPGPDLGARGAEVEPLNLEPDSRVPA